MEEKFIIMGFQQAEDWSKNPDGSPVMVYRTRFFFADGSVEDRDVPYEKAETQEEKANKAATAIHEELKKEKQK